MLDEFKSVAFWESHHPRRRLCIDYLPGNCHLKCRAVSIRRRCKFLKVVFIWLPLLWMLARKVTFQAGDKVFISVNWLESSLITLRFQYRNHNEWMNWKLVACLLVFFNLSILLVIAADLVWMTWIWRAGCQIFLTCRLQCVFIYRFDSVWISAVVASSLRSVVMIRI